MPQPAISLFEIALSERPSPVGLAVAFNDIDDAPTPIVIRTTSTVRTYLAAVVDRKGRVHEWLELDIANNELPAWEPLRHAIGLSGQEAPRGHGGDTGGVAEWDLGFSEAPPPPLVIDPQSRRIVPLVTREGSLPLQLCKDRELVRSQNGAGVGSSGRVLWTGDDKHLLASDSLANIAPGRRAAVALGSREQAWLSFNESCGTMSARRLAAFSLPEYLHCLRSLFIGSAGDPPLGIWQRIRPGFLAHAMPRQFLGVSPLAQYDFLRLKVWRDCVRSLSERIRARGQPLFNVDLEAFRVETPDPGGLPWTWMAQAVYRGHSEAVALTTNSKKTLVVPTGLNPSDWTNMTRSSYLSRGEGMLLLHTVQEVVGSNEIKITGSLHRSDLQNRAFPSGTHFLVVSFNVGGTTLELSQVLDALNASGVIAINTMVRVSENRIVRHLQTKVGGRIPVSYLMSAGMTVACDVRALGLVGLCIFSGKSFPETEVVAADLQLAVSTLDREDLSIESIRTTIQSHPEYAKSLDPSVLFPGRPAAFFGFDAWSLVSVFGAFVSCTLEGPSDPGGTSKLIDGYEDLVESLFDAARSALMPTNAGDHEIHHLLEKYALAESWIAAMGHDNPNPAPPG